MVTRVIRDEDDITLLVQYLRARKRPYTVDIVSGKHRTTRAWWLSDPIPASMLAPAQSLVMREVTPRLRAGSVAPISVDLTAQQERTDDHQHI